MKDFQIPSWIPLEPWNEWIEMRKRKRAPNTTYALRLAVKHLAELQRQGFSPQNVLDNCIMCGWVGIWPPRASNNLQLPLTGKLSEQDKLDFYRANGVWPQ